MEIAGLKFDESGAHAASIETLRASEIDLVREMTMPGRTPVPPPPAATSRAMGPQRGYALGGLVTSFPFSSVGIVTGAPPPAAVASGVVPATGGSGAILFDRMVLTCAHCVMSATPAGMQWNLDTQFLPGFPSRIGPDGRPVTLNAAAIYVPQQWMASPVDFPWLDYAMIITQTPTTDFANIGLIADIVGRPHPNHVISVGYPRADAYAGNDRLMTLPNGATIHVSDPYAYQGPVTTHPDPTLAGMAFMPDNDLTVGASGGPWLYWADDGRPYCCGVNKQLDPIVAGAPRAGMGSSRFVAPEIWDFMKFVAMKRDEMFPGG
jgi:hypothetical protein